MPHVSRPLIGLLVGTVAFFALWLVALKPSPSSNGKGPQGLGQYQGAINAAHNAVKVANGAAAAQGGNLATPSGAPAHSGTAAASAAAGTAAASATAGTAAKPSTSQAQSPTTAAKAAAPHVRATRLSLVDGALRHHRVVAMLFYNPAAADDRLVKQELATVPRHNGRVVKLAVPISELTDFPVISNQVNITQSPTLVLIDPAAQATTIVGFADTFEIAQRVDDALAVK
jgi:hypothetical protein